MSVDRRNLRIMVLLGLALGILMMFSVTLAPIGVSADITPTVVVRAILQHIVPSIHNSRVTQIQSTIVWDVRLPRALVGLSVGMLLAMAGVAFQSFLMNPMADPYMVGVSAGSALGSAVIILLGGTAWLSGMAQPLGAFLAGLFAMAIVTALARINGRVSAQTFLLAGFVIGTFIYSLTKLMISLANRQADTTRAASILSQLLGSLNAANWQSLWLLAPLGIVGGVILMRCRRELNLMTFGEESAARLGVDTEKLKRNIILSGSMVTAATVAVGGIIGFVGMIVPHMARRLVGPDHHRLLPCSMLIGGIVLVAADLLSRVYLDIEVGVVTAIFGAPVFCYLLRRRLVAGW